MNVELVLVLKQLVDRVSYTPICTMEISIIDVGAPGCVSGCLNNRRALLKTIRKVRLKINALSIAP